MTFISKALPGKNIIFTRWVFNTKRYSNNFTYEYKIHFITRSLLKIWGIDYNTNY